MKTIIQSVSIFIPERNRDIERVLKHVQDFLNNSNIKINDIIEVNPIFDKAKYEDGDIPSVNSRGDVAIIIGGDGTVLKTLLILKDKFMPILSIGLGELNFISSTDRHRYINDLEKFISGKFYIRNEMRLDVHIEGVTKKLPPILNEVLYHSSKIGKTLLPKVEVSIGGYDEKLWMIKSDGVLVSTPIGSTAYSYAAGGPILDTNLDAIIVTPLIPTTKIPSYVVNPETRIVLSADKSRSKPCIVLDGQIMINLDWDQKVIIKKSDKPANIITFRKDTNLIRMKRVARRYGGVRE